MKFDKAWVDVSFDFHKLFCVYTLAPPTLNPGSVPDWDGVTINMEFEDYDVANKVWERLASRFIGYDGAQEHNLRVAPSYGHIVSATTGYGGKHIMDFHSRIRFL